MEIIYSDRDIVVCIKPVGLDSEREVPEALKAECPGEIYPIHRLDKNVGGVMVYARTKRAAAELSRAVQQGLMIKEYVALVKGRPDDEGLLEDLLWKDSKKNKVYIVDRERKGVKRAKLEYFCLEAGEISKLRIRLHTGRSHQIRVQFAGRGFPLLGDHKYGARDDFKTPMLFSCKLTFPYKGGEMSFERMPQWI